MTDFWLWLVRRVRNKLPRKGSIAILEGSATTCCFPEESWRCVALFNSVYLCLLIYLKYVALGACLSPDQTHSIYMCDFKFLPGTD